MPDTRLASAMGSGGLQFAESLRAGGWGRRQLGVFSGGTAMGSRRAFCGAANAAAAHLCEKRKQDKKLCAVRESNPGLPRGRREFYH